MSIFKLWRVRKDPYQYMYIFHSVEVLVISVVVMLYLPPKRINLADI
jgi:hypothetical protein